MVPDPVGREPGSAPTRHCEHPGGRVRIALEDGFHPVPVIAEPSQASPMRCLAVGGKEDQRPVPGDDPGSAAKHFQLGALPVALQDRRGHRPQEAASRRVQVAPPPSGAYRPASTIHRPNDPMP